LFVRVAPLTGRVADGLANVVSTEIIPLFLPQSHILNHQHSTFSNHFIENTQTPSEFSIEFESIITTRTSSPKLTIYDDPAHQQCDFNGTKDISSHEPEQASKLYVCESTGCGKS